MNLCTLKTLFYITAAYIFVFLTSCQKDASLHKGLYDIEFPQDAPVITILGSSTAEGAGATPLDSSWAKKLQFQLIDDAKEIRVINLAKGGYTTFKALPSNYNTADPDRNIDKALSYNPDLIILAFPTNDVAYGYSDEQILENYYAIIEKIIAGKRNYIILSTQPRDFPDYKIRKRLFLLNEKLILAFPDHITNFYNELATPDLFIKEVYSSRDGVHLNNTGHHIILQAIMRDSIFQTLFY